MTDIFAKNGHHRDTELKLSIYIFLDCSLLLSLLTTGKTNLDCWDNNAHCKTFVIFHDYEDLLYLREEELETEKQVEKEV